MATIERQDPVALSQNWGVTFSDYKADGKAVDFQDLMIYISANRATTVEGEVAPLTTRIRNRNAALERLGTALADLTKVQADFASDAAGDKRSSIEISQTTKDTLSNDIGGLNFDNRSSAKWRSGFRSARARSTGSTTRRRPTCRASSRSSTAATSRSRRPRP